MGIAWPSSTFTKLIRIPYPYSCAHELKENRKLKKSLVRVSSSLEKLSCFCCENDGVRFQLLALGSAWLNLLKIVIYKFDNL